MIIKCVVQLELIQAIDNIVFYPNTSREEDQVLLNFSQVTPHSIAFLMPTIIFTHLVQSISSAPALPKPGGVEQGMFRFLSTAQMFVLLDCLEEAHTFSRTFNLNNEQRTLLMKAGQFIHLS